MNFGLSFLPDANNNNIKANDYYKNAIRLSVFAEEINFNTIKMTEHYLHDYGGYCPSPLMFLASIASLTKNIRLMTGCILPAFHHPIQIAAKTAQLDAISNGRVDVGFARAYLPYEFSAFNIDMDESRSRYEETISATIQLWTQRNVTISSKFFNFKNVNSLPLPTQKYHPPIWGAAVNSRQSFAWLGEQGFGLLVTPSLTGLQELSNKIKIYRECFVPNSVFKSPTVTISLPLLIRHNEKDALLESDNYLSEYTKVWANATDSWNSHVSNNYPGYTNMSQIIKSNTPSTMRETNQAIIGNPDTVIRRINELVETTQVNQILWQVDFGAQPLNSSMETLKLFNKHVYETVKGI
jgi:alkanesulfonate monooxygenase SsuD/methylene tetrahydromethanopterin reductase-like flavin-dependent oxidoreductase (luciferase family)